MAGLRCAACWLVAGLRCAACWLVAGLCCEACWLVAGLCCEACWLQPTPVCCCQRPAASACEDSQRPTGAVIRLTSLQLVALLQDFVAPPGALPPLLVKIHGGPTSQASTAFSLGLQYWTSRG